MVANGSLGSSLVESATGDNIFSLGGDTFEPEKSLGALNLTYRIQ